LPLASTIFATATASSIVVPPSISSSPQSRTPSTLRGPITSRTAATISSSSRARFSSDPPHRSVRLLVAGERKPRTIEECEHCSSTPSKPPSMQCPATLAYPAMMSRISCSSTAFGTSRKSGSATGLGAHTGSREYMPEAWPPLWLICARIGTPCACTASVIRR